MSAWAGISVLAVALILSLWLVHGNDQERGEQVRQVGELRPLRRAFPGRPGGAIRQGKGRGEKRTYENRTIAPTPKRNLSTPLRHPGSSISEQAAVSIPQLVD